MKSILRVLLAFVVLIGIVGGAVVLGVFDRPTIETAESRFVGVNGSTTLVETDLVLSNPNPVGVRLGNTTLAHSVTMNGIEMGTGSRDGFKITEGATNLTLTTAIDNEKIPAWWVTHIENGERTRFTTTASVEVPLLGRMATVTETSTTETHITDGFNSSDPRPVNASLPLLSNPVLVINRSSATWGNVTRAETPLNTEFVVSNPTEIPFVVSRIDYTITMNDITVGNGTTGHDYTIPAEGQRTIQANAVIENDKLDDWWVTHIERNQHTDLRVAFTAVLELPDGETVRIPLDSLSYTTDIDTDVLGAENGSGDRSQSAVRRAVVKTRAT
jgi:LEA14-like dessication related protein